MSTSLGTDPDRGAVRHLLELVDAIRPMPASARRLAIMIANNLAEIDDVVAVVRDDPLLAATLLREANSAASSSSSRVTALDVAVMRLGLARVLAIASMTVFGPEFDEPLPAYRLPAGELVRQAVCSSHVAEALLGILPPGQVDAGVVAAALLHDLGKLVLNTVLDPDEFERSLSRGTLLVNAERELALVDHAELTALMLEAWKIPDSIVSAVRHHHDPLGHGDPGAMVVAVADVVARSYSDVEASLDDGGLGPLLVALGVDHRVLLARTRSLMQRGG